LTLSNSFCVFLGVANQNLVDHLDTPKTQTSLDNSKDIIALAKSTTTLTPAKSIDFMLSDNQDI
jgi:hypothetical protein